MTVDVKRSGTDVMDMKNKNWLFKSSSMVLLFCHNAISHINMIKTQLLQLPGGRCHHSHQKHSRVVFQNHTKFSPFGKNSLLYS